MIGITEGPSLIDPTDAAPITITNDGTFVKLAATSWTSRMAIWLLRRYVKKAMA